MKSSGHVSDVQEVVVDASSFDESALAAGNDVVHSRPQSRCHSLSDDLWDHTNKADGAIIFQAFSTLLLRWKGNVGGVEKWRTS